MYGCGGGMYGRQYVCVGYESELVCGDEGLYNTQRYVYTVWLWSGAMYACGGGMYCRPYVCVVCVCVRKKIAEPTRPELPARQRGTGTDKL